MWKKIFLKLLFTKKIILIIGKLFFFFQSFILNSGMYSNDQNLA